MILRWIVANWLKQQAAGPMKEAVAEAVQKAAQQASQAVHDSSQQQAEQQPEEEKPQPCDVGIVYALGIESGGLVDLLAGAVRTQGDGLVLHEGGLGGRRVVIVESGVGCENAARATAALVEGHHPKWIISTGFAGALHSDLKRNDLLMANSVAMGQGVAMGQEGADDQKQRLSIDLSMESGPGQHVGRLLTVNRLIDTPEEKKQLGQIHDALAVDMETFAVAKVCSAGKVRFLAVRVISDTLDDRLPKDIENLMKQTTLSARIGAVAGSVFRRPGSVKDMWKLREDALLASDALAKFLAGVVAQLPTSNQ